MIFLAFTVKNTSFKMGEFKTFPKPVKKETLQKWGVYRKYSKPKKIKKDVIMVTQEMRDIFRYSDGAMPLYLKDKDIREYAFLFRAYSKGIANISGELYNSVKDRSGGRCEICGGKSEEIHHLVGRRRTAHLENLIDLCIKCHKPPNGIHANMDLYWEKMDQYQQWCKNEGYDEKATKFLLSRKDNGLVSEWETGERLIFKRKQRLGGQNDKRTA